MNPNTASKARDLSKLTQADLADLVNAVHEKHGHPEPSYDSEKNTLFGWTEEGTGVWVLPGSKPNSQRFEEVASSRPDLGHDNDSHCEIKRLAGAEYFDDWRDSDRARAASGTGSKSTQEGNGTGKSS